jgi:hypothetical protein
MHIVYENSQLCGAQHIFWQGIAHPRNEQTYLKWAKQLFVVVADNFELRIPQKNINCHNYFAKKRLTDLNQFYKLNVVGAVSYFFLWVHTYKRITGP